LVCDPSISLFSCVFVVAEDIFIYLHKGYWSMVFFAFNIFFWLWHQLMISHKISFEKFMIFKNLYNILRRIDINSSVNIPYNVPGKPSVPGFFPLGLINYYNCYWLNLITLSWFIQIFYFIMSQSW
jgi:hypothetical protein